MEANVTGNIAFMWQKDLLHLSQQIQTLKQTFQNMKVSIQRDLQMIRTDLENKLGEQNISTTGLHTSEGKGCPTSKLSWNLSATSPQGGWGKTALTQETVFVL